jgi:hypothetical protein
MVKCKKCEETFENDVALHRHLRSHKILIVDYYHAYYPRKDLFSGDLIKFKNKNQYFSEDFNNRTNMKQWFKTVDGEQAKNYCHDYIKKRMRNKALTYTPSEVEVRSLMCPPVPFLQKSLGNYYHYAEKNFSLINKYTKYPTEVAETQEEEGSFKNHFYKIFVDTREQKPLKFNLPIEVQTLKFGDYAFSNPAMSLNTYIERKSITDFIGTMSGGLERFKREIERSEEQGAKLVVLVEESLSNCLSFNHLPYVTKKIKASPEFIFHNVRDLLQTYSNLHFLFVKGRIEATRVIEKLFLRGGEYRKVDLQLAYDLRKL